MSTVDRVVVGILLGYALSTASRYVDQQKAQTDLVSLRTMNAQIQSAQAYSEAIKSVAFAMMNSRRTLAFERPKTED